MKIGILTLHYGANYGGTLQCLALYNILKRAGNEVEVIDFQPRVVAPFYLRILYSLMLIRSVKDLISLLLPHKGTKHKSVSRQLVQVFDEFRRKHLILSESCNEYTISHVSQKYDAIYVGSDQVWSSTVRSHLTYFGDWSPQFTGKLYSYAACAVTLKYPFTRKKRIKQLLERFEEISVRDKLSSDFVHQFLPDKKVRIDLDPTLLYSFDDYISAFRPIAEEYILVYVLGDDINGGNQQAIDRIKDLVGNIKVIAISVYGQDISCADLTIKTAAPEEWINYIKYAKVVFTDSFHCAVFSIKFGTQFYVYYSEENRASRILELSKLFNLKKQVVTSVEGISNQADNVPLLSNIIIDSSKLYLLK